MIDPAWAKVASDWAMFGLGILGGAGAAVWGYLRRRDSGVHARLDAVQAQAIAVAEGLAERLAALEATSHPGPAVCAAHSERLARIEEGLRVGVTHADMGDAHKRMDQFEAQISKIMGTLTAIEHQTGMLVQHLLEHGPRVGDRRPS